jgi:hypothetical protein
LKNETSAMVGVGSPKPLIKGNLPPSLQGVYKSISCLKGGEIK